MIIQDLFESPQLCPECGGISFSDLILAEKKDACYYKVKASAKVWPSAYASGRLVQCRKKGAANYGKSKNEGMAEGKVSGYKMYPNHDGTWYVEDENENVVLRNASEGEAQQAVWSGNQKLKQGVAEGLNEFAPPGSNDGGDDGFSEETLKLLAAQWYNGDEDPRVERTLMAAGWEIGQDEGYDDEPGVFVVQSGDVNGSSYISWPAHELKQGMAEDAALAEEFDLIESTVERLAKHNAVDAELIWEDLESLSDDELYVFAVTMPLTEDWQKANKQDRTDGMSRRAVKAYRREHPGSKLKTAVTTKPSKLKRGSKASKRRKSYCSRSRGQMKMHSISCAKTPDKAICKARRRWNCE